MVDVVGEGDDVVVVARPETVVDVVVARAGAVVLGDVVTVGRVVAGAEGAVVGGAVTEGAVVVGAGRPKVTVPPGGSPFSTWFRALLFAAGEDVDGGLTASQRAPEPRNRAAMAQVERRIPIRLETGRRRSVVIADGFTRSGWSL